jgi:hypothetical protein
VRAPRPLVAVLAVAAAAAAAIPVAVVAVPGSPALPDLVPDPPLVAGGRGDNGLSVDGSGPGARLLLRFDGYVHNAGSGPLEVDDPNPDGKMDAHQVVYPAGVTPGNPSQGTTLPLPPNLPNPSGIPHGGLAFFETADGHNHWHVFNAAAYSLWNEAKTAAVAPASKVGFCMYDSDQVSGNSPQFYDWSANPSFCQAGNPGADTLLEGVSPGWRDIYNGDLALQWVDVSDVAPGRYWLAATVDPNNFIKESNESNNGLTTPAFAALPDVVPGFVAQSLSIPAPTGAATITLQAARFSGDASIGEAASAAPSFRIVTPPRSGTLNVAAATPFASPAIVYTPNPGSTAPDSFTYVATDPASAFPRTPVQATVTIAAPAARPTVSVSGPTTVVAGTAVALSASVVNGAPGVSWSVEGTTGTGSPALGTVVATGASSATYTAPAAVPAGGVVHVRATSPSTGVFGSLALTVRAAPEAKPAQVPSSTIIPAQSAGTGSIRLIRGRAQLRGKLLLVRVTPTKSGVITVTVKRTHGKVLRCRARAVAGRQVACRFTIASKLRAGLKVRAELAPLHVRKHVALSLLVRRTS